jgi:flagellar hook-basal body complex protein FliE
MAVTINPDFRPIPDIEVPEGTASGGPAGAIPAAVEGSSFSAVLADAVGRVESYRVNAEKSVNRFLLGEEEEVHKVALATQQAELSFDLFLQVKNKVVQAYQEVMRMQL